MRELLRPQAQRVLVHLFLVKELKSMLVQALAIVQTDVENGRTSVKKLRSGAI